MACRALARISSHSKVSDLEPPEYYLELAYKVSRLRRSPHEEAVTRLQQAEIEVSLGRDSRAIALLEQAHQAFVQMDMRWHQMKAEHLAQTIGAGHKTLVSPQNGRIDN